MGTQPEEPPGTAHPHREPTTCPTGSPQPLTPPVPSAHGSRWATSQAAATQARPEPRPRHGTTDRPAAGQAYAPPDGPPTQAHTAAPSDTTAARPSDTGHPHTHGPRLRQRPARRTYRPQRTTNRRPSGTTPHEPGLRRGRQSRHLLITRPPARAPARSRHAPPPQRAPHSLPARKVDPSRRQWRKATPEGQRNRQTMKPNRLHYRPNRSAGSPRWARRKCGGPQNGHQRQHQRGSLAGEQTGRQCRVRTHGT